MSGNVKRVIIPLHPRLFQLLIETIYLSHVICPITKRTASTGNAQSGHPLKMGQYEEKAERVLRRKSKQRFTPHKLIVHFFVIRITKKLTTRISASILKNVNSITENKSTNNEEMTMKLLNKIIAMFENININFGTFNQ
ncbi:hypothetical protein AB6D30_19025 [Pectobacterium brasiliense]|uniref:hypothetical protein n=1 Tax=Pectobacterium TaxID=122277 RepID=UPI0004E6B797|nr:hypothetical protein [Pectobacterium brasiliense]GKV78460.1 hypothetical protein PEC106568_36330 [Pectobacterium carotovorum subsp. carotovorum]KFF72578.1 hypothetical protein IW01_02985 [Pectobacterium brasiliense]KHS70206.1 hypothetical protein RC79_18585 [Pectobacterium brasiliense]KHS71961.1 hypothetical protein RC77_02365 [Pectobacterium brasiliense]KHS74915.1 hypothetical protein QT13_03705 [Pectobacterium brasiliense]